MTSRRLEKAIQKLYVAFHNNQLNPACCKQCAVGNMCDNIDSWKNFTDQHGSLELNQLGRLNQRFGRRHFGYLPSELLRVEAVFLKACGYKLPLTRKTLKETASVSKDQIFDGLSAVVAYLCALDGVQNYMDYSKVFEYDEMGAIYDVEEVLA